MLKGQNLNFAIKTDKLLIDELAQYRKGVACSIQELKEYNEDLKYLWAVGFYTPPVVNAKGDLEWSWKDKDPRWGPITAMSRVDRLVRDLDSKMDTITHSQTRFAVSALRYRVYERDVDGWSAAVCLEEDLAKSQDTQKVEVHQQEAWRLLSNPPPYASSHKEVLRMKFNSLWGRGRQEEAERILLDFVASLPKVDEAKENSLSLIGWSAGPFWLKGVSVREQVERELRNKGYRKEADRLTR
jgi:hypothetical protein